MTTIKPRILVAFCILLSATFPAYADICGHSISRVQVQLDTAIEKNAGAHGWGPESLNALRGHQPTPRSLAAAEDRFGSDFTGALDALDRARAADRVGDMAACSRELARVRSVLR